MSAGLTASRNSIAFDVTLIVAPGAEPSPTSCTRPPASMTLRLPSRTSDFKMATNTVASPPNG
jgi:hypothetical protein